jgi:hypothetical protein
LDWCFYRHSGYAICSTKFCKTNGKISISGKVIGVLGLKLMLALPAHYFHESAFFQFTESEKFDLFISILTVSIFLAPVITSYIFNLPGRKK